MSGAEEVAGERRCARHVAAAAWSPPDPPVDRPGLRRRRRRLLAERDELHRSVRTGGRRPGGAAVGAARATIVRTSLIYGGSAPGPQERLAQENRRFYVDEIRSPVQVGDLADALLELLELSVPGPLHVAGADAVSRFDFAVRLGADPARLEAANTTPDRAPNVSLDSSRAASLLATRLRGVYEVLPGS